MVKWLILIGTSVLAFCSTTHAQTDTCVSCHLELDEDELEWMEFDVHIRQGLSCVACHGGDATAEDPDESMDPAKGYVGSPKRSEIPRFCGTCHQNAVYIRRFRPGLRVDQLELYWTSVHGQRLREGDNRVATCVDCHNKHGILPASDARSWVYPANVPETCGRCHNDAKLMSAYGVPADQYEKYKRSVHGHLLLERGGRGAPACNDCHGNHGAVPPGVSSVSHVCGQCHPVNAELVGKSPHAGPFREQGIPVCERCHGNHEILHPSDEMLGTGATSTCTPCHEEDSAGYLAAAAMKGAIERLQGRRDQAAELLGRAERAGMEVHEAKFQLNEVENYLTKARAVSHASSLARLEQVIAEGDSLAGETIGQGERALAELQFRRKGLGASLIVIVVVGYALFLKIREEDQRRGLR